MRVYRSPSDIVKKPATVHIRLDITLLFQWANDHLRWKKCQEGTGVRDLNEITVVTMDFIKYSTIWFQPLAKIRWISCKIFSKNHQDKPRRVEYFIAVSRRINTCNLLYTCTCTCTRNHYMYIYMYIHVLMLANQSAKYMYIAYLLLQINLFSDTLQLHKCNIL